MLDIDWQNETLEIEAVIRPRRRDLAYSEALIECDLREIGAEDLGEHAKSGSTEYTVTDENGNALTFRIHDVFAVSPEALIKGYDTCDSEDAEEGPSELADAEDDEWDEDFEDVEREFLESFSDGEKLLFIDFSTDEDIRLEMYAEEYLDAPANNCMMPGFGIIFGYDREGPAEQEFFCQCRQDIGGHRFKETRYSRSHIMHTVCRAVSLSIFNAALIFHCTAYQCCSRMNTVIYSGLCRCGVSVKQKTIYGGRVWQT